MPHLLYPETCPKCGHSLARSRRRGIIERMFRVLKIRVFRCHRCGARFYSPPAVVFNAGELDEDSAERREESASIPVSEPSEKVETERHIPS